MEPGDTFGEIALLDGRPRTAGAIATAPSELFLIKREQFLRLLASEPVLTDHLLRLLCARLRWVSGFAEESALLAVPARLARRLLSLGRLHGRDTGEGIELKVSQDEMARFLGLSRQIVNQHLQSWKARRWVGLGRGKIVILDALALDAVVAGEQSAAMMLEPVRLAEAPDSNPQRISLSRRRRSPIGAAIVWMLEAVDSMSLDFALVFSV